MTRTVSALILAAVAAAATVPAASAMEMEFNMLTGAVYNELVKRDLPTDSINDLTIGQLAAIKDVVDGDDSEGKKTNRIEAIIANN